MIDKNISCKLDDPKTSVIANLEVDVYTGQDKYRRSVGTIDVLIRVGTDPYGPHVKANPCWVLIVEAKTAPDVAQVIRQLKKYSNYYPTPARGYWQYPIKLAFASPVGISAPSARALEREGIEYIHLGPAFDDWLAREATVPAVPKNIL